MASKTAESPDTGGAASPSQRLLPPKDGVVVRMYRIGHGDCFLLAFPGRTSDKPAYVLIDCGYKPGSPEYIKTAVGDVTRHIRDATGGHIDVAVITHEHQDHVNGITEKGFAGTTIGQTWLAWTEDPEDELAIALRQQFHDQLLGLLAARHRLAADNPDQVRRIDQILEFELGGDSGIYQPPAVDALLGAAGGGMSMNKKSMRIFKDLAQGNVRFMRPHEEVFALPGAKDVRVFALGPPRDTDQLKDLNPQGHEEFRATGIARSASSYFAAAAAAVAGSGIPPFARRYRVAHDAAVEGDSARFFTESYGTEQSQLSPPPGIAKPGPDEIPGNPEWRRIDKDWLHSAERLALDLNDYTNNGSLVLAFELGRGGKVLLFAADAQRGNWASWAKKDWQDGDTVVTARDLLARTVLYKVGHHGSHNATLNGLAEDEYANLAWMATGEYRREFTAMITAVRAWAETQKGWDHPLKAIKDALMKKTSGRVFQTDTDLTDMREPQEGSMADWERFQSRTRGDRLYFDYTIIA